MKTPLEDGRIKGVETSHAVRAEEESLKPTRIRGSRIQRTLIVSFLLLGTIPMLLMGILSYSKSSRILLDRTNVQMRDLTAKGIEQLNTSLTIYKMQMDNLYFPLKDAIDNMEVGIRIEEGTKEAALRLFTDHIKKYPAIRRVRLLDPAGQERFTTLKDGSDPANESAGPWFQEALGSTEVCLSEMFLSKETNEPMLIMGKAVYGQIERQKTVAVIAAEIWGKHITSSFEHAAFGNDGYTYVLNQEGDMIAYPDKTRLFQLNLGSTGFGREMLTRKNGALEYRWEGKTRFASFQEYPQMNWIIVTSVLKEDILSSVDEMRNQFILMGMVMACIALASAIFMSLRIARPIHRVVKGLTGGVEQVSAASGQISQASQQVAQGASEQASNIEETSSSLEEIASMIKQNATHAGDANRLISGVVGHVTQGKESMERLRGAVGEIKKSSDATSRIVKTIDEIAFQTNLLALNAAVEAARAGEAGKGFAVVAEEVRNLAQRAGEAARNTAILIDGSIRDADQGVSITSETEKALSEITENVQRVSELIAEITAATKEQSQGIDQVAAAVAQINQVTQGNAANAEESASASEELNAQVGQVNGMIRELSAIVGGSNRVHNGVDRAADHVGPTVGTFSTATAGSFSPGRGQATAHRFVHNQAKPKRVVGFKPPTQKDPRKVIPFHEDNEKDKEILKGF